MFTGIVEGAGEVQSACWPRLAIRLPFHVPPTGASVAVSGVCLTVVGKKGKVMLTDVMEETRKVTTLGTLVPGTRVNIERAMSATAHLDGHIVQGHVDGTARLLAIEPRQASHLLTFQAPKKFAPLLVDKGSVTLDGISLTIVHANAAGRFSVSIIPHTWQITTLHQRQPGDLVNLETDILARMIHRQIQPYLAKLKRG